MSGGFIFQTSDMSESQAKNVWGCLQKGIKEIQNGNASALRFEELYRNAYTLVLHKHGELLYNGVENTIVEKLLRTARILEDTTDNRLIEVIVEKWNEHKLTMTMIRDILMYMDKTYCELKKKTTSFNLGVIKFKKHICMNEHVLGKDGRLRIELLNNIKKERNGEKIDESLMRNCLRMFVDVDLPNNNNLQLYDCEFEKHFKKETREYYQYESELFITQNTVPEYLIKIEQRLLQEKNRGESYIPIKYTRDTLTSMVEFELIGRYAEDLINNETSGCIDMFNKHSLNHLKRMFELFNRVGDKIKLLRRSMYDYIKNAGESIVNDKENIKNPEKFVEKVLHLRERFQEIVEQSFNGDKIFNRKLKEAFEYFINLDVTAAQYLSLYTDALLRTHSKKLTENEVNTRLDNVITIFKYLSDKDVFEDFYKQHLADRLLHMKSVSDQFEKSMISKLKTECGHQFTSKLEGMFKDIEQSQQINEKWKKFVGKSNTDDENIDLNIQVLTTGFWPFNQTKPINLPKNIDNQCELFRNFYCNSYSGRKLQFDTSRGSAELRVSFSNGEKTLVVHTYAMCVLLLYNTKDTYTYKEIKRLTGLQNNELEKYILALAHPKIHVLKKLPNKKLLLDTDTFTFNNNYKNARLKIHIGMLDTKKINLNTKEKKDNQRNLPQHIIEKRKNRVEAAIVRIMKTRKKLSHSNLIIEVVHQLKSRFNPEPSFIKQRISSLIEREYLERDQNDRRIYHYLA